MLDLLWAFPLVCVVLLIVSGRTDPAVAGLVGLGLTVAISILAGPASFAPVMAAVAIGHGLWLSAMVGLVILGGLFFRDCIGASQATALEVPVADCSRSLFSACFLTGPFSECLAGFGLGQLTAAAELKKLKLPPRAAVVFGLFSQVLTPWGAMGNPTVVGAVLSGLTARDLGTRTALIIMPLMLSWLAVYWLVSASFGMPKTLRLAVGEAAWVVAIGACLYLSNRTFGPDLAGITALAPLIVARAILDHRSCSMALAPRVRGILPYLLLMAPLVLGRLHPGIRDYLEAGVAVQPFADIPPFHLLTHPGFWLLLVGTITLLLRGRGATLVAASYRSIRLGSKAITILAIFFSIAQVMSASGMALAIARDLGGLLGPAAVFAVPLFAGTMGLMIGSGNASNGLLMPSAVFLAAESGSDRGWIATAQNVAACGFAMISLARVSIGCALVGNGVRAEDAYRKAWPLGALALVAASAICGFSLLAR